jgi:hypothetical protein
MHQNSGLDDRSSTDEGRMISSKPVSGNADALFRDNFGKSVLLNAPFSIRDNFPPDSNVTEESEELRETH